MIIFLLYTCFAIIANGCLAKVLHASIQDGNWLDGWQKVLTKLGQSGVAFKIALTKPLGYCSLCFSHLLSVIGFIVFCLFMNILDLWVLNIWLSMIWYLAYVNIATVFGLFTIERLFK